MNDCIISTRQLSKSYGNRPALENFSIDITSGSITGLIGRNGSGKTTLMKLLAGQLEPTDGEVRVFSEQPADHLMVLQNLVYTYHNYKYPRGLLLSEILSYYRELFESFDQTFAEKLVKYFDLKPSMKYH